MCKIHDDVKETDEHAKLQSNEDTFVISVYQYTCEWNGKEQ